MIFYLSFMYLHYYSATIAVGVAVVFFISSQVVFNLKILSTFNLVQGAVWFV